LVSFTPFLSLVRVALGACEGWVCGCVAVWLTRYDGGEDVEAATKLGIIVVNSPSGNIRAAAEHTIALLMATARNIPDACASLKGGKWERARLIGIEVKGKTLGIVGLGKGGFVSFIPGASLFRLGRGALCVSFMLTRNDGGQSASQ
jgi:hypothetical protein